MLRPQAGLAAAIADRLRNEIVRGHREPSSALRQDGLAEAFGVSKIPVREALTRLESEGLVRLKPHHGFVVAPLCAAEAREVFFLRAAIEPAMMAEGAARAGPEADSAVRAALSAWTRAKDGVEKADGNRLLHLAMAAPAAQPLGLSLLERLLVQSQRYVALHLRPEGRADRAEDEHAALVEAWLGRDLALIRALAAAHVEGAAADLDDQLRAMP